MLAALTIFSLLLILSVLITLVRSDYWLFKVLEYPRLQKMVLMIIAVCGWVSVWQQMETIHYYLFALLCAAALYNAFKIFPYTLLAPKELKRVRQLKEECAIKIFSANVLQDNNAYDKMLQQIQQNNPDVIFLLETNDAWAKQMSVLHDRYPYRLLHPLPNTYGLLFFSKLPVQNGSVSFHVKKDIPSVEAVLVLRDGTKVQVWGLHPEPPIPGENLYATAKDKELMKVALKARKSKLPCLVFGDMNDVAWSHTTRLFRKTSKLLDPRIGRGFYNTFSAHHWWVRFPLDYIFCSADFGLVNMKRLPKNGSDHFATLVHLQYAPKLEKKQTAPEASAADVEEAAATAAQPVQ